MIEVNEKDIAERIIKKMRAANVSRKHIKLQNKINGEDNPLHTKFDTELSGMWQLLKAMGIGYAVEYDDNVEFYAAFIIDGVTYPTERQ